MRILGKITLAAAVTLLILLLTAFFLFPVIGASVVEKKLRAQLDARHIDATWNDLSFNYKGNLLLNDYRVNIPSFHSAFSAKSVRIALNKKDLFRLDTLRGKRLPRIDSVEISGGNGELDLEAINKKLSTKKDRISSSSIKSSTSTFSHFIQLLLDEPPKFTLENLHIQFNYGPLKLLHATIETAQMTPRRQSDSLVINELGDSSTPLTGDGWDIHMTGTSQLQDPSIPPSLLKETSWVIKGTLQPNRREVDLSISGRNDTPLFSVANSDLVRATVGSVSINVKNINHLDLRTTVNKLALSLGSVNNPAFDVHVKEVMYRRLTRPSKELSRANLPQFGNDKGSKEKTSLFRSLVIKDPTLSFSPSDIRKLPESLSELKNILLFSEDKKGEKKDDKTENNLTKNVQENQVDIDKVEEVEKSLNEKRPQSKTFIEKVEDFLPTWNRIVSKISEYKIKVDNLLMDVVIHKLSGEQRVTIVQSLDIDANKGAFKLEGRSAGGTISAQFLLTPSKIVPPYFFATIKNVDFAKIPGMPKARSGLPNRGTSGRLGGDISASLSFISGYKGIFLPDHSFKLDFDFDWRDGEIDLVGVSDEPINNINVKGSVSADVNVSRGRVWIKTNSLQYGPIKGSLDILVTGLPLTPYIMASGGIDEIECQRFFRNMPTTFLGPYRYLEATGKWSPSFKLRWHFWEPDKLVFQLDNYHNKCHITALNALAGSYPNVVFNSNARAMPARNYYWPEMPAEYLKIANDERRAEGMPPLEIPLRPMGSYVDDPNPLIIGQKFPKTFQAKSFPKPPTVDIVKLIEEGGEPPKLVAPYDESFRDVTWLNKPFVKQVTEGVTENDIFVGPGTPDYVPIRELPGYVPAAAYLSEEIDFYMNRPLAIGLIERALRLNLERGRFQYGGSTVTQQLVKNLFLSRDKTLMRKFQEALIAWRITEVIPRNRILELYLNCIEFGPNIYGIGPAARYYFQKDARDLEPLEAIFLAMLKPSPLYGEKVVRRGKSPSFPYWLRRRQTLFDRLLRYGYITKLQNHVGPTQNLRWEDGTYVPLPPIRPEDDPTFQTEENIKNGKKPTPLKDFLNRALKNSKKAEDSDNEEEVIENVGE